MKSHVATLNRDSGLIRFTTHIINVKSKRVRTLEIANEADGTCIFISFNDDPRDTNVQELKEFCRFVLKHTKKPRKR